MQVTEILDNAIDEVQAGHASTVQVLPLRHQYASITMRLDSIPQIVSCAKSDVVAARALLTMLRLWLIAQPENCLVPHLHACTLVVTQSCLPDKEANQCAYGRWS